MKKIFALTFAAAMACATSAFAECATGEHGAISIQNIGGVCTAVIYGDSAASDSANKKGAYKTLDKFSATVDSVYYFKGVFAKKSAQSIVLPFAVPAGCVKTGLSFHSITKIYKNTDNKWTVYAPDTINVSNAGLSAHTPYIISLESGNKFFFELGGNNCQFEINTDATVNSLPYEGVGLNGSWMFKGTYERVQWNEGNSELGRVYGLASKRINAADGKADSIKIGQFVKGSAGVSVSPLKAYLLFQPQALTKSRAVIASGENLALNEELPDGMDVVLSRSAGAPAVEFPEGECFDGNTSIIEFKTVDGKRTACIDGQSEARLQTLSIPEDVVVDDVVYNRNFKLQTASTIMLPFSIPVNSVGKAVFYKLIALIKYCDQYCNWTLDVEGMRNAENGSETDWLMANTPYIIWPGSEQLTFNTHWWDAASEKQNESVTLNTSSGNKSTAISAVMDNRGDQTKMLSSWSFRGTYERIVWDNPSGIYGFASVAKKVNEKEVAAGEFVKAKSGANIAPMRAYLKYNGISSLAKSIAGTYLEEDLPETITIRFLDGDGSTTAIGSMNTLTGEIKMDDNVWFDMKGRKMNKKPTVKGTYYNKGQKVIIK